MSPEVTMRLTHLFLAVATSAFALGFLAAGEELWRDRLAYLLTIPMIVIAARMSRRDAAPLVGSGLLVAATAAVTLGAYFGDLAGTGDFYKDNGDYYPLVVMLSWAIFRGAPAVVFGGAVGWLAANLWRPKAQQVPPATSVSEPGR